MAASCIRVNQVIDWKGQAFRLVERLPCGDWRLRATHNGVTELIPHEELLSQYRTGMLQLRVVDQGASTLSKTLREAVEAPIKASGKARKANHLVAVDEGTRKRRMDDARKKASLCKVAEQYPLGSALQAAAIRENWLQIFSTPAPERLPSIATLWRWQQKLESAGFDSRALVRRDDLKGRKKAVVEEGVADIIREATQDVYLTLNRRSMRDVDAEVVDRIRAENSLREEKDQLAYPPLGRIKEYIHGLPEFEKYAARHGLQRARRKFRSVLHNVFAERALERVELDATRLNFIAIDDQGLPLGRPWLHVCIDVRTRCILGYYISYEPPSLASLFECLKHAVLPKDHGHLRALGVERDYSCHGVWERLVIDNAFENHSSALDPLVDTWGGDIQWCPRRTPWYKARIERFIRTFSEKVCQILPGTTFSGILQREDYDPVANAVISWRDIERITAIWIVDVYHQKLHSTLQCSPMDAWRACVREDEVLLPCSTKEIEQVCRVAELRRLTHKGIERYGLYWNSDALTQLRYELGAELDVRVFFDRMNLGFIGVEDPRTRDIIEVQAVAADYAMNLTLHQHRVTRAYARRYRKDRVESVADWMDGQRRILQVIDAARGVKRYCLPAPAARFLLGNGQRVLPAPDCDADVAVETEGKKSVIVPDPGEEPAIPVTFVQTARRGSASLRERTRGEKTSAS